MSPVEAFQLRLLLVFPHTPPPQFEHITTPRPMDHFSLIGSVYCGICYWIPFLRKWEVSLRQFLLSKDVHCGYC